MSSTTASSTVRLVGNGRAMVRGILSGGEFGEPEYACRRAGNRADTLGSVRGVARTTSEQLWAANEKAQISGGG
ncbi:hypothetical protein GCM10009565_90670 [Amycolatopsis albidoflavus]